MSKITGSVNTRGFPHSKPKPPAIVGTSATSTEVGFVLQRTAAAAREPIYAKVGEYVMLGQRNVKQLADTLASASNTLDEPLSDAGFSTLYPEEKTQQIIKDYISIEKGEGFRSDRMSEKILVPITQRLEGVAKKCDWGDASHSKIQLDNVVQTTKELEFSMKELDQCDVDSGVLTIKNQILRIARNAHDSGKIREATGDTHVEEARYEHFFKSLPERFRPNIHGVFEGLAPIIDIDRGGDRTLCSPEGMIVVLMCREYELGAEVPSEENYPGLLMTEYQPFHTRTLHPSVSSPEEAVKLTGDSVAARSKLLEYLLDEEHDYKTIVTDYKNIRTKSPQERDKILNEILRMDGEISNLIVKEGFNTLNNRYRDIGRAVQLKSIDVRGICVKQSLNLLEALTQDITGGVAGNVAKPKTLLDALDLGERALTDDVRPLWSFTFDNEDSETQFDAAEQLKREASYLSGMVIAGMGNVFADVEALNEAKVAHTGIMISQLLLSSPSMRDAVVEVMGEELKPNPASHLGTLSRGMPTVSDKASAKVMHDIAVKLGRGSGDTSISGGKWTQLKKALEFILKRPTHWLMGLPLVFGVLTLVIGASVLGTAGAVPGLIIAGTLALSSGFLLMILGASQVPFQLPYLSFPFGLVFGIGHVVAKVFASDDHLTQLWKVTQGDRKATLAYYKSKGLDDSSGVNLTRKPWHRAVLAGDLHLLRAQAAQEYVVGMGNAGLEALIKSAEERLVKLGKLGPAYNSTGSEKDKRRSALAGAVGELGKVDPGADGASKAGKAIKKAIEGKSYCTVAGNVLGPEGVRNKVYQALHLYAFPEIVSLAGCLMREEALGNEGTAEDRTIRCDALAIAMDRVRSVFLEDDKSTQKVALDLTTYKGVVEAFFGRELSSDYMGVPLPRNTYTVANVANVANIDGTTKKLSSVIKKRMHVGGEALSKKALFSPNIGNVHLKSLEDVLFPPGIGFDIPTPFRELELTVEIDGEERKGTFDVLVEAFCSRDSSQAVKAFTRRKLGIVSKNPGMKKLLGARKNLDSSFLKLLEIAKSKSIQDDSVWEEEIGVIKAECAKREVGEKEGNYKIIVASLCDALVKVAPGAKIGSSGLIKPEKQWDEESIKKLAAAVGVDLDFYYCDVDINTRVTETLHGRINMSASGIRSTEQLKEFFEYMKNAAPKEVPFLVKKGVTAFHEGWDFGKVLDCLFKYSDDLGKFASTHGALGGDVLALQNCVRGKILDMRAVITNAALGGWQIVGGIKPSIRIYTGVTFVCPPPLPEEPPD